MAFVDTDLIDVIVAENIDVDFQFHPAVTMEKITANQNSLGEVVLNWKITDTAGLVETCIIVATYQGVTAPLGAVPRIPGISKFEFVDRILNAYVGKKEYRIVFVQHDGTSFVGSKHATFEKGMSIPWGYLK